jgi:hypothetical protein
MKIEEYKENIEKKKLLMPNRGYIHHTNCLNSVKKFHTRKPVFHLDNILCLLKNQIYLV